MKNNNNEKRKIIILAARQLFAEKGFDKTTVDEIMERANLSKGTFYTYFKSKEELIKEIAIGSTPVKIFERVLEKNYESADKMLMELALSYISKYNDPVERRLFLYCVGIASRYEMIRNLFRKLHELNYVRLKEKLERMSGRTIDWMRIRIFMAGLFHYVLTMDFAESLEPPYEYSKKLIDLLLI
jgi:AcrR family transcriptional regulator